MKIGAVPAGRLWFDVAETVEHGRAAWRFSGRAESAGWIDKVYRVNDSILGVVDQESFLPLRLEIEVDESGERGRRAVRYFPEHGLARYERERTFRKGGEPDAILRFHSLVPGSLDVLALFFKLRGAALDPDSTFELPVHEKGKNGRARVRVGRVATLESEALGAVRAVPLRVEAAFGDKLASEQAFELWVTEDPRRVVVRFRAVLRFADLRGELVEYRRGAEPGQAAPLSSPEPSRPSASSGGHSKGLG